MNDAEQSKETFSIAGSSVLAIVNEEYLHHVLDLLLLYKSRHVRIVFVKSSMRLSICSS